MYETKYKIGRKRTLRTVYERANLWSSGGHRNKLGKQFVGENAFKNYIQRQKKREATVKELITNNFGEGDCKFISLGFSTEEYNKILSRCQGKHFDNSIVKECNAVFKNFIKRLRYRYTNLKYVAVIEFQKKNKRNAIHYHMVCNLPYIEHDELLQIWGKGSVWIENTFNIEKLAKYCTKDIKYQKNHALMGEKGYLCSKGLQRDIIARSWVSEDDELIKEIKDKLKGKKGKLIRKSINKYAGKIEHTEYRVESNMFKTVDKARRK